MKLSWEWKLFLLNTVCQTMFVIYTSLTLYIGICITLPDVYKNSADILFNRKLLAIVLFINLVGNYVCIKLKSHLSVFSHCKNVSNTFEEGISIRLNNNSNESNCHKRLSSDDNGVENDGTFVLNGIDKRNAKANAVWNLAGWYECLDCKELAPPRSKHCPLCRSCILKRDHHCFFAGCCIGFHNQRYFINFCLYGAFGASYSTVATYAFIKDNYDLFQDWGLIAYFPPIFLVMWIMGYASSNSILFVLFLYWSVFITLLCIYFVTLQTLLVFRGQTKYELKQRIFPYRSDSVRNVMSVFGPSRLFCLVGVLVPMPFVGYFGDGKAWDELFIGTKIS